MLVLTLTLACSLQSFAQKKNKRSSAKTELIQTATKQKVIRVEGGRKHNSSSGSLAQDSTKSINNANNSIDSLMYAADSMAMDSMQSENMGDSLAFDSTKLSNKQPLDSNQNLTIIDANKNLLRPTNPNGEDLQSAGLDESIISSKKDRFRISQDTLPAGRVTLYSIIAPGFGQLYNKQWWKMPIIYAGIGGFLTAGIISNNQFKIHRTEFERLQALNMPDFVINQARVKMRNSGALRTSMFALAGATYLYSLADATFNYRGKTNPIRKATTLAALFPGAGFIYTQTYWRIPIYYGAGAALATVIDYNNRSYVRFNNAYKAATDNDPTTIDEFDGRYTTEMLKNVKNSYRRTRDLAIIGTVAVYIISIIDTHVTATLKNWDMSDDLSIRVEPSVIDNSWIGDTKIYGGYQPAAVGMTLKLAF